MKMSINSFAEKLKSLFVSHRNINEDFYDALTDVLIEGDIGAKTAVQMVIPVQ